MGDTGDELKNVELKEDIFSGIKYYVTGDVHEKVIELLKCGKAERMNYFSDYVNHLIVGDAPEDTDITDASDVYEIPALTPKWVVISAKLKKLVNKKAYLYNPNKIFAGMTFCLEKMGRDTNLLWGIITYNGGVVQFNLSNKCTHLVTVSCGTRKFNKALNLDGKITIITPDWVMESLKQKNLADANLFHPKLINWPKIVKTESTTSITGFEPDVEVKKEVKQEDDVANSTQALLDKLKSRMPWNQPPSTSNSETIGPPNVVAPSFQQKQQQSPIRPQSLPQSPINSNISPTPQQIPRSIVHHTPQTSVPQQTFPQQQPINIQRLLSPQNQQNQMRPSIQQLRGQLPNPIHQQLLQQRLNQQQNILNQQQQQPNQRPQMVVNQQLLQRQLIQNQLQNQPQNQQQLQLQQLKQQIQQQNQQNPNFVPQNQQFVQQQQQNQQQQQMLINQPQQLPNQQTLIQNQQQQLQMQNQQQLLQQQQQNQQQLINQQQLLLNQQQQPQNQHQIMQNQQLLQNQQQQMLSQQQQQQQQGLMQQNQQLLQQNQHQVMQNQQLLQHNQPQQQHVVVNQQQQQFQQSPQQQQQNQQFVGNQQFVQQQLVQKNLVQQQQQQSLDDVNVVNQQQFVVNQQQQQQVRMQQQQQQIGVPQQQQIIRPQFQPQNQLQQQQILVQNQQQPRAHFFQQQPQQVINQPQQVQQQQQPQLRHPINIVQQQQQQGQQPRQWSPTQPQQNMPVRQYIQLDANTHNQLQKMPPEQRALFVAKLQKERMKQVQQQRGGSHILIRGQVPAGLNHQQQVQWLQQQAKQQGIALPPNLQQQNITPGTLTPQQPQQIAQQPQQITPGLSPLQQTVPQQFQPAQNVPVDQNSQQQLQIRQYRLQQLQIQREQAQKAHLAPQTQPPQQLVRPLPGQTPVADSTTPTPVQNLAEAGVQHPLVVNAKTKTALANMLSIRLQSGGTNITPPENLPEQSAAGTLRLMTAQHNAALNSNPRPQELMGLQQRPRVISGPNGEIIRAPGPVAPPVNPISEPNKLQYGSRPPVPVQHRPGPFYGHNPNLKLPANLFLLGCIFVVVEIERYLDDSLPGWQQKIEKHGGEVERQYCNRVTHVLCETQRHGVVMQALRDCKRCVTIYWLSDVMKRRQVLPPWTALHLPTIYLDTTPASKHLISISGFTGADRNKIKHMISYTGAKMTSYFSKHNTLLVAAKTEGPKYSYAKKCGISVVNVQWLTDVMLGNFTALSQMEHVLYQQYSTPPNFSFDPKHVPNLMHAWKMPINISQESYERVKRSASPVLLPKAKKQKTENTDENDNIDEIVNNSANGGYRILFSMATNTKSMERMVRELGATLTKNLQDCTHLVMPQLSRSIKLMFALTRGVRIVPESWLIDSHREKRFLDENSYKFDAERFNKMFEIDFYGSLLKENKNKLFEGYIFWITPSVSPSKKIVQELIEASGGFIERVRRSQNQICSEMGPIPSKNYVIITHSNDIHLIADLLKLKKNKNLTICNAEFVFFNILNQKIEFDKFLVKVL